MSRERKECIQQQINAFATGNLADNAIALFQELSYKSNKQINLKWTGLSRPFIINL